MTKRGENFHQQFCGSFNNEHLKQIKCNNAVVQKAGSDLGLPGKKFDAILVSASVRNFPKGGATHENR